jgi:hypothetical protein
MATSLSLENDPSLAQGYIKVNGTTAATLTTSGITGNLTGNADTATKLAGTTGSAPSYACRAWVNFDGTRDTTGAVSTANTNRFIRSSGNVTSVLRNSVGNYTITFTTPMSNANYVAMFGSKTGSQTSGGNTIQVGGFNQTGTKGTSGVTVGSSTSAGLFVDQDMIDVAIFGN